MSSLDLKEIVLFFDSFLLQFVNDPIQRVRDCSESLFRFHSLEFGRNLTVDIADVVRST